jgi:beta-galactosidase
VSSQFGILDTCGFPKDGYYYLKAWWTDEPELHQFPHWSWPGREGEAIEVRAHSNCDEVELFLNGTSLGRKAMPKNGHLAWAVPYSPGTLLARGYREGREIATARVETTGAPALVTLEPDRDTIAADGSDVAICTVAVRDAEGRVVPTAGNLVQFSLEGPGRILGVGNGDPSCLEPDTFVEAREPWTRSVFNGLAQIIVQSLEAPGEIVLTAEASDLAAARVTVRAG